MPVFLEVRSGQQAGKKIRLEQDHVLRVGRSPRADLAFADDSHMSGVHFNVGVQGRSCHLTDLNSRNGTLVNGQTVNTAVLGNQDTIVAGETTFMVVIEADEMPAAVAAAAPVATTPEAEIVAAQTQALALLQSDFQPLFAVLDSARDIQILGLLFHSKEEFQSLYEGPEGAKMANVAPYLVRLGPESPLLKALVKEGWGKSWGVYLTCTLSLPEVRRHLRHFLQVRLPDGEQVYFRYYDPRVLRVFLPTCVAEEVTQFLGPITRYITEGEKPDQLWEFTTFGRGAQKKVFPLAQAATQGISRGQQ